MIEFEVKEFYYENNLYYKIETNKERFISSKQLAKLINVTDIEFYFYMMNNCNAVNIGFDCTIFKTYEGAQKAIDWICSKILMNKLIER